MRNFSIIILIVSIISSVTYSQPFWQQTNGPFGGPAYQIVKAPSGDLYAAAGHNGLYKSTNNGTVWIKLTWDEIGLNFVQAYYVYAAANGYIYAAGGGTLFGGGNQSDNQGIFRSTDNGSTWAKVTGTFVNRVIGFAESSNGYIYAARLYYGVPTSSNGGVFRSTNNGDNWTFTPLVNGVSEGLTSIAADNNGFVYASEIDLTGFSQIWISSNYGASWTFNPNLSSNQVLVKKSNGYVFAKKSTGVFLSTNQGSNWTNISSGTFASCDKIWLDDSENLYAASGPQLYRTSNHGLNWTNLSFTFPAGFNNLLILQNTFYASTGNNFVLSTTNFGANWLTLNAGVINTNILSLSVDRTGIIYALRTPNALVYKSTDNGINWEQLSTPAGLYNLLATDSSNNVFIASAASLYRSSDNGSTWNPAGGGLPASTIKYIRTGYDDNLYACTNDTSSGIFKSTNNGTNWVSIGLPLKIDLLAVNSQGHVYAVQKIYYQSIQQYFYNIYLTTNNGANWSLIRNSSGNVTSISYNHINDEVYITDESSGFFKSTDSGQNWTNFNNGISHSRYTALLVNPNGSLYAAGLQSGLGNLTGSYFYLSTNNGSNWTSVRSGWPLHNTFTTALTVGSNGFLYAGTYRFYVETPGYSGVWRSITSSNNFAVTGTIRYQDNNELVTSGYVKAVKYFNSQQLTLDSAVIQSNGSYILTSVPQDSIDIMAFQDDEDYLGFVPTFYQSAVSWQQSNTLYPTGSLNNINIGVYRISNTSSSSGKITGAVYGGTGDYYSIKDARIYAKLGGVYKAYSVSISNGTYSIDSLPNGSYELTCDMIGYAGQTRNVTLNGGTLPDINFYLTDILIAVQNISSEVPRLYALYQNYPNPFNPVTKIVFDLPKQQMVRLVIFDILGREVAVLENKMLQQGKYSLSWNAAAHSSGVYFYRLSAGDYSETKKLVLIK